MASAVDPTTEVYDLLILVDATASMSSYIHSFQTSLPQIIQISTLTECFSRIGLLAYRDYDCHPWGERTEGNGSRDLLDWSGWTSISEEADVTESATDLVAKAKSLSPMGGRDWPEATKTGLARAYELMRAEATTIVLLYTDAGPHTASNGSLTDNISNLGLEQTALSKKSSYGGFGQHFTDWVTSTQWLSQRLGDKKAVVFSILAQGTPFNTSGYYNYLSTRTGGACFSLTDSMSTTISKFTVELLLAWMGTEKMGISDSVALPAYLARYINIEGIDELTNEMDLAANRFFLASSTSVHEALMRGEGWRMNEENDNVTKVKMTAEVLKKYLPKKITPVQDFSKRYATDPKYKSAAIDQLQKIISQDVSAITFNPIFGSLWRAVCNDRENPARDGLITAFGLEVDRIRNIEEKARMKSWLEESYDYTAEVMYAIGSIPEMERFPCVCLDPTLAFGQSAEADDENDMEITSFRRDELLEIGRSCDYKILRRLGKVMTRLTFIKSRDEMPAHIAAASETEVPRIPMALAAAKYKRQFWRILLHIVVPGTMLSARPAALLAGLSIRLGIQPLFEAADSEMLLWRDRWNNLEVPETWNVGCLTLLLDANQSYKTRMDGIEDYKNAPNSLLKDEDQSLFERLVSYKMLEMNLDTSLNARVGWAPEKSIVAVGPTVICVSCQYPRSVTMMGSDGKCGYCLWSKYSSTAERDEFITTRASRDDTEQTPITWVECNLRNCRAQYVVYRPETLNVKPKCHYCRVGKLAPVIECHKCSNRVIYPIEYRPVGLTIFECYACASGLKTIVDVETTVKRLCKENTTSWLLRNDNKLLEPFNKRSVFNLVSKAGVEDFCNKVELFPKLGSDGLNLEGKHIHNAEEMIGDLQKWINRRKTESGTCSLCFSDSRKADLQWACGRTGCSQKVCKGCLNGWYGLNEAGKIINTAALSCPFCRRDPTAKTLFKYGMGIHAVGNLRTAVEEKGEWISAWCGKCGHAKRFMERLCAAGAPIEVTNWTCDACKNVKHESVKECPGCGTMTEKISGCDHITCTVEGCGAHWCFYCGENSDESSIYAHMNEAHGGFYGGAEEFDEDEEDDDQWVGH
ncbi:hypothetical protein VTL71DRAFT_8605 [Oculimacula yallundae]|uniref:RBR-type E3 ubiquitin transferase n=1 Tax=Oculimacula yallundae TaxID=86028 RepID=A0ABR4CZ86_9HELO